MIPKLECVLCENLFSEEDIYQFLFFSATRICYKCYKKLFKVKTYISCFGKQYSSNAVECRELCPDRKICPKFFTGKIFKLRKKAENKTELIQIKETIVTRKYPFRPGSLIDKVFKMAVHGIDKLKLKRWCTRHSTSYYRMLRVLKKETKYGKAWHFHDRGKDIKVEYNIR
jgi:hypothetical protein